jgi:ribonuclease HI
MYLTFGKYRYKTVKEVVEDDYKYSQWLITQPWFTIKHKTLHHQFIHELNEIGKVKKHNDKPITNSFIVYTDGACKNNGSKKAKAGIGIHFSKNNRIKIKDVSERLLYEKQTNNAAELMAILKCLELCYVYVIKEKIYLYTDSEYSIKCITIWYREWIKNDKCSGKKNIDILHKINNMYHILDVEFIHIRAHTGSNDIHSLGNEMADKLAVESLN